MGLRVMKASRGRRGLSCDHKDGVEAARHRLDAVTATTSRAARRIHWKRSETAQKTTHALV